MKPALSDDRRASRVFFIKRFLALLFLSVVVSGAGMIVLYAMESKTVQTSIESESSNLASLHKKHIEGLLSQVRSDLTYLTALVEDQGADVSSNPSQIARLLHLFLLFMREKPIYDQICIIDTSGHEVLRLNLGPDGSDHVSPEKLQDKSGRDYVRNALGLSKGEIYVSRLDLNVEYGAVELPPKPVLRFAMPVFAKSGHRRGIVVLNLLGNTLFKDLLASEIRHNIHAPVPLNTMMLDAKGYWVYAPLAPSKEYGFMYPDRKNISMASEHPVDWTGISKSTEGEHLGPDGLYVFKTVDASLGIEGMITGPGHPWKVIVFTSTPALAMIYGKLQKKFLVPYAFLVTLLAVISGFLAEAQTRSRFAEAKIAHLAHHDHLTGLANRLLFHNLANLALSTAHRNDRQLALLFLDLDRFKPINDKLGHEAGDEALREIATRIQGCIRRPDIVARLGGDEFAVLLQDIDGPSGALKVANKIIDAVSIALFIRGMEQRVGVSIGISIYPRDGKDIDTLLRLADNAMYRAKGLGGGRAELGS